MKKASGQSILRLFLSSGLILALIQFNTIPVFGVDENPEEQLSDINRDDETDEYEEFPTQIDTSPEPSPESIQDPVSTEEPKPTIVQEQNVPEEVPMPEIEEISENEQESETELITESNEDLLIVEETEDLEESTVSEQPAASEENDSPAEDSVEETVSQENETGTITIDNITFSPDDDVTSGWSDGKGWKNVAGQYVTMVNFNGSNSTVSADIDVLTLAVAGVNRIGTLTGDCSYRIVGSGIVLIEKIDITDGNTLTLHPNTALYNEGSAAVFLKQDDESYLLINGGTTGILDDDYTLDNIKLRIPKDSSLTLNVMVTRTETWIPEGSQEPETDITRYMDGEPPYDFMNPTHTGGSLEINNYAARLNLGKNCSLTVDKGASIQLKEIKGFSTSYLPFLVKAVIGIQGTLNINGTLEGGCVEINNNGSLIAINKNGSTAKDGKILSSEIILDNAGNLQKDLPLKDCSLTIYDKTISTTIDSSVIYLKGTSANIQELNASGDCYVGIGCFDTYGSAFLSSQKIGNIAIEEGGNLYITANDHYYVDPPKYAEDCYLTISGTITGGTVSVLAGMVEYTGNNMNNIPAAPDGYASRVLYVNGTSEIVSPEFPLNMTMAETEKRAEEDTIQLMVLNVIDSLISEKILTRSWVANKFVKDPIQRNTDQKYTSASFLKTFTPNDYDLYYDNPENPVIPGREMPGVEIIYRGLNRQRLWIDDPTLFTLDDVVMIRILNCTGQGGQGGGSSTNTYTSFTGNGQIGSSGGDSIQLGDGMVIYGSQNTPPEEPEPEEPTPTEKPEPEKPVETEKPESDNHKENDNTSVQSDSTNTDTDTGSESTAAAWTEPQTKNNTYTSPYTYTPVNKPQTVEVSTYNVHFNTDGGTKIDSQTVNAGTKAARPNDPVKEGFLFGGWYKDEECTEVFDFTEPVSGNTTIYAKWTEKEDSTPETIKPAEPEKKSMNWVWISLAGLGAAGVGTCIVLLRKDEEE